MKKIVFGITSLGIGGAERVLVDLVNKLQEEYEITIFTLYKGGAFEKELNPSIKLISMYNDPYEKMSKLKRKIIPIYVLICGKQIYNKYIKGKFDTEVAFLEGPITRIFKFKSSSKKIVWVHNDIRKVFGSNLKSKLKRMIDKRIYKKYDNIVFVSEDNKKAFNDIYINDTNKKLIDKEKVIYNYVDKERILKKSENTIEVIENIDFSKTSIVTVARLVEQKAIDRLARVHKRLIDEGIEHNVYIIGDGPEKAKLKKLIEHLDINTSFKLLGEKKNPYPYIKKAKYFALLTYFEGYPMAVEEAKILNKKIIITNTAAVEVVKEYDKSIVLENNEEDIYEGLKRILKGEISWGEGKANYDNTYLLDKIRKIF